MVSFSLDCSLHVSKRVSRGSACEWNLVENPENFPYVARYCHPTKDTMILKLYDADEKNLLAARMYFEQDMARIYWIPNEFLYDTGMGGSIPLPPTFIDRVSAKLP